MALEPQKYFRMSYRDPVLLKPSLHLILKLQQPDRVRHRRAALANPLGDVLLFHRKIRRESVVRLRLLDWVQILALQVLNQCQFEHVPVGRLPHDDGHRCQSDPLRGAPAPFSGDNLVLFVSKAADQRLDDAVFADGVLQFLEMFFTEAFAGLKGGGSQAGDG